MLVLVIDTSSAAVIAALAEVGDDAVELRAQRSTVNAKAHGELLAPSIADCLDEAGVAPRDLGAIVAGLGPGPFTGLRVGLVTAAAMADALGVPSYGVCSLDGIAASAQDEGELIVATDARRKEVYWARYDAAGERVSGPNVNRPADVPIDGVAGVAGAGARLYRAEWGINLVDVDYPSAVSLVGLAADRIRRGAPSEQLVPLYLRRPDAVPPGAAKTVTQ
ncbi:MAG TPA: tRNA (adenosine(37)-N6)-threonylcarbamoyltransferase complex dimerization subunit type 1 TsaB [Jatrophihabitantaceae bacterium]|nr:tRNA (adenosine(37)-N6)-threonylcarbamoyltransferase complex dimerization subunit type 1 TsaB [Jatrophihabitantaceae bacterium]